MGHWLTDFSQHYGMLTYAVIFAWTFFEGETVVLVTGALICNQMIAMPLWGLGVCAFLGSAAGDQTWYFVGRRVGAPILDRRPKIRKKFDLVLNLLTRYQTLYILFFRFVYGIRSVSPFIIGISGIKPQCFVPLNLIAAALWAVCFTYGGYFVGRVLDHYLVTAAELFCGILFGGVVALWVIAIRRQILGIPFGKTGLPPSQPLPESE